MDVQDAYGKRIDIDNLDKLAVAKAIWEGGLQRSEFAKLLKYLPFQHPAVQVAYYLKKHGLLEFGSTLSFDEVKPCDNWSINYQERLTSMNLILKVFTVKDNWNGF